MESVQREQLEDEPMFCRHCGAAVANSQPFCGACGSKQTATVSEDLKQISRQEVARFDAPKPKPTRKRFVLLTGGVVLFLWLIYVFGAALQSDSKEAAVAYCCSTNQQNPQQIAPPDSPQSDPLPESQQPQAPPASTEDHRLHLLPNLFGSGAVSDGRTYSVKLISNYADNIPSGTLLFFQGIINGQLVPGAVTMSDEQEQGTMIICQVSPNQDDEITNSSFWTNRPIQAHGLYVNNSGSIANASNRVPVFRDCEFADPTDKVVRPQSATNVRPDATQPAQAPTDIEEQIKTKIQNANLGDVTISVTGKGKVTISGTVANQMLRGEIFDIAADTPGVTFIDDDALALDGGEGPYPPLGVFSPELSACLETKIQSGELSVQDLVHSCPKEVEDYMESCLSYGRTNTQCEKIFAFTVSAMAAKVGKEVLP